MTRRKKKITRARVPRDRPAETVASGRGLGLDKLDYADLERRSAARVNELRAELSEALAPFDAYGVLFNLLHMNLPLDPEKYKETTHQGLLAIPEYAALLFLGRGDRYAADAGYRRAPIELIRHANDIVHEILNHLMLLVMTRLRGDDDKGVASLRFAQLSKEMFLRNPSFPSQEVATLRALLAGAEAIKRSVDVIGFSIDDALMIFEALVDIPLTRLAERGAYARELLELLESGGEPTEPELMRMVGEVRAGVPASRRKQAVRDFVVWLAWTNAGSLAAVSADDLIGHTGVDQARVAAFMSQFAIKFGEANADGFAFGINPVRQRPVIADRDGQLLCVAPSDLLFALRPAFERAFKASRHWEWFQRSRKKYLEDAVHKVLTECLRPEGAFQNLAFHVDDQRYELDSLILLGDCATAIEDKAGALTDPARRAAPESLRRDLRKLIEDAAEQGARVLTHLRDGGEVLRADGTPEPIPPDARSRGFALAVTLDDLSALAPGPELWEAGLMMEVGAAPLIVSLHDLELICDLIELPAMFVHFLSRRERIRQIGKVSSFDELDMFMYYLNHGLYLDEVFSGEDAPDMYRLSSFTDELDAYVMYREGSRKTPAEKPRQKMPKRFRRLLSQLDQSRPKGWLQASLLLLDMSGEDRARFDRLLGRLPYLSAKDGGFHDYSATYANNGVTLMTGPSGSQEDLAKRLEIYCLAKKHQVRAESWTAFGVVAGEDDVVQIFSYNSEPWSEDAELDELVAQLGLHSMLSPEELHERAKRV